MFLGLCVAKLAPPTDGPLQDDKLGCQNESMPHGLVFPIDPVILANIGLKPPHGEFLLFVTKPFGGSWEVWKNEDCRGGEDNLRDCQR